MRRWIILSCVALGSTIARGENFEQCVERTLRASAYPEALKCLRDAEQTETKSYRIAYLFGVVFLRAGQPDSAIVHLRRAVELKDDYVDAIRLEADALTLKKDYRGAIPVYQQALALEKRNPSYATTFGLGHAYAMADSFKAATLWLSKASDLDKQQLDPYIELGDLYMQNHVFVLAKEEYEAALGIQPRSIEVRRHLAQTFIRSAEYDSAVAQYNAVLAVDSADRGALKELADIYALAKQWHNARIIYHRLGTLDPSNVEVLMSEGHAAYRAKEYSEAISPLNAVISGNASDSLKKAALKLLAQSYFTVKKRGEAVTAYEQLMQRDSSAMGPEDYRQYAGALLDTRDTVKAFQVLELYTLKDSTDCEICKLIGPRKMVQKEYTAAIVFFKLRLKRCDTVLSVLKNIGLCYQVLEKPDSALLWYGLALEKKPYDGWATSKVASIYYQKDRPDTVLAIYKDFLAHVNPDSTPSAELGEAYKYIGIIELVKKEYGPAAENLKKAMGYLKEDCEIVLWLAESYHNLQQKEEAIKYYKEVLRRHCKNEKTEKTAADNLKLLEAK